MSRASHIHFLSRTPPLYDFVVRTTGFPGLWAEIVARANPAPGTLCLDVCTGTAGVALARAARGVHDHDLVRVWNDFGSFHVRARVAPRVQPGELILYHAWEPFQFRGWKSERDVIASPCKPTHLVGDYGHLRQRVFQNGPVHAPRGVAVEIERVAPGKERGT